MVSHARTLASASILALAVVLAWPMVTLAAPVQYDFFSGRVEIEIFEDRGRNLVVSAEADLVASFFSFDEAVPALLDFELIVDDPDVDLGAFGSARITLSTTPGSGFDAPAMFLGGTTYRWVGGPIDVVGELAATGGLLQSLLGSTPLPIAFTDEEGEGYFLTGDGPNGERFGLLSGRTVTEIDLFGETYKLQIGNVFKGVVPEPAVSALLAIGLLGFGRRLRR